MPTDPSVRSAPRAAGPTSPFCEPGKVRQCIEAPWRSLLYRNVDTPFIYTEDFTIFPHMPRNSAGFDCRAPQILGNWMVSIPARPERPDPRNAAADLEADRSPQPFVEVLPDDPGYAEAVDAAERRLQAFNKGKRYGFCPDTTDIVDPVARKATSNADLVPRDEVIFDPQRAGKWRMVIDGVPDRAALGRQRHHRCAGRLEPAPDRVGQAPGQAGAGRRTRATCRRSSETCSSTRTCASSCAAPHPAGPVEGAARVDLRLLPA